MPIKAIPAGRDRLQSRLLAWLVLPLLCYTGWATAWYIKTLHLAYRYLWETILIGGGLGYFVWRLKAATAPAATFGAVVCVVITLFTSNPGNVTPFHTGLVPLFLLFVLTFIATGIGRERKVSAGLAESPKGRSAAQVIANLGAAGLFSSQFSVFGGWSISSPESWNTFVGLVSIPMLAALAEATADTVASEIGQAFGGTPRMLLTLRPVPPGTDGAITPLGTLTGIAAAALVAASAIPALGMTLAESTLALAAAAAGLFFDSLLGATLERRGWINNDLVNFLSTAFAATVSLAALRFLGDRLLR